MFGRDYLRIYGFNIDLVSINDVSKLDLRVGLVKEAVKVDWSEKLLRLRVDFGEILQRLKDLRIKILRTDIDGKIEIVSDGKTWNIR